MQSFFQLIWSFVEVLLVYVWYWITIGIPKILILLLIILAWYEFDRRFENYFGDMKRKWYLHWIWFLITVGFIYLFFVVWLSDWS